MVTTTKCPACGEDRVLESMIEGVWVCRRCYDEHVKQNNTAPDVDGYDKGYADGVYDAITIIRENGHPDISVVDVLRALAIRKISESL